MHDCEILILGAGFSGLSSSYHLGHDRCVILEGSDHIYGHCRSRLYEGVIWDEGPHVSFTKNNYVRELFARSVENDFAAYDVDVGNYYKGAWIRHPAQVNLYQVPEPLRSECIASFLNSRMMSSSKPSNYNEWLEAAFGKVFTETFPAAYTRKYWTCEPEQLETSWLGQRVYRPDEDEVINGAEAAQPKQSHYITSVRYPKQGGYEVFGQLLAEKADIRTAHEVIRVDLEQRRVYCSNGETFSYQRLISTIPLPIFINACAQAPDDVINAVKKLACTSGFLVNVLVPHKALRPENWLYVYDEDKLSTRITFVDKLAGHQQANCCAIQVEVYHSTYKHLDLSPEQIRQRVVSELYAMGLIDKNLIKEQEQLRAHITDFKWGNVIFDHHRLPALQIILDWLATYGLVRENGDLAASGQDWDSVPEISAASLALAGRYAQWKYFWSDDCILRGRQLGRAWA